MGQNSGENNCVLDSGLGSSPSPVFTMALSASPESPTGSSPDLNGVDFDGIDHCSTNKLRRNLSDDQVADILASEGRRPSRRRASDDEDAARTARRLMTNKRERYRQQLVNDAFSQLRHLIPTFPPDKKLSKHDVLKQAARYIHYIQTMLSDAIEQQQRSLNPETAKTMTGSIREKQDWHFASMYTHMPLGSPTQTMASFPGALTPSRSAEMLARQPAQPVDGFPRTNAAMSPTDGYFVGNAAGGFPGLPDGQRPTVAHQQGARQLASSSPPSSESYGAQTSHPRSQGSLSSSTMTEEGMNHVQPQAVPHSAMRQHSIDDRSLSPGQQQQMHGASGNFSWMRGSPGEEAGSSRATEYAQFQGRSVAERHGTPQQPQQLVYAAQNEAKGGRQYVVSPSQAGSRFADEQYRYVADAPRSESYMVRGMQPQDSFNAAHRPAPQSAHAMY